MWAHTLCGSALHCKNGQIPARKSNLWWHFVAVQISHWCLAKCEFSSRFEAVPEGVLAEDRCVMKRKNFLFCFWERIVMSSTDHVVLTSNAVVCLTLAITQGCWTSADSAISQLVGARLALFIPHSVLVEMRWTFWKDKPESQIVAFVVSLNIPGINIKSVTMSRKRSQF